MKREIDKLGKMLKHYVAPMLQGGADIYMVGLFDEFLNEKEGDIRRALGVHHTYPVVKPLKRLFREFVEERNIPEEAPRPAPQPPPAAAQQRPQSRPGPVRVESVWDDDEDLEEGFDEDEPVRRHRNPWD